MNERLEDTIRDRRIGVNDEIVVHIKADGDRENDFHAIREAVREVLD